MPRQSPRAKEAPRRHLSPIRPDSREREHQGGSVADRKILRTTMVMGRTREWRDR